jgi:16S rRNA (guanine966-N2)-methyltransferase
MRVVAGVYRGRRLRAPAGLDTRPTSDRVRESLFAILGDRIDGAHVLDLFAGTGALGIEALSRGAETAVFVESDRRAVEAIQANLDTIEDPGAELITGDAFRWLMRAGRTFDIVLLDPPYSSARKLAGELSSALPPVLADDALIVTESNKRDPLILDFPLADERTYGSTRIGIHRVR